MIKKFLLIIVSILFLSGCNLAISFLDSTMDDEVETEPTPEPTAIPTERPEPTVKPDPVIINGGFEDGNTGWDNDGNFTVIGQAAFSGSFGARIASEITTNSYVSQHIRGLIPYTEYVLSFYTRSVNTPGEGRVIIRDYGETDILETIFYGNTAWTPLEISFTPNDSATEVTIAIYCDHANVDVDDIKLEEKGFE